MKSKELDGLKKELAKLHRKMEATESLINDAPEDVPEPRLVVYHNSKLCEFSLLYEFDTIEDFEDILHAWLPWVLPLYMVRNGSVSFLSGIHDIPEDARLLSTDYVVNVSTDRVTFSFYVKFGNHLVSIKVESKFGANIRDLAYVYVDTPAYRRTMSERCMLKAPAFDGYKFVKWASGSHTTPNNFTIYWEG